jgi:hypothetical protein
MSTEKPFLSDELRAQFEKLSVHDQIIELSNRVGSYYDESTSEPLYRFLKQIEDMLGIVAQRTLPAEHGGVEAVDQTGGNA